VPRTIDGAPAIRIRRVSCRRTAPPGTIGTLLNDGCPLAYAITAIPVMFAEGHGIIYQGAGWLQLWEHGRPVSAMHFGRARRKWWQGISRR
jgi:hypothetical protein